MTRVGEEHTFITQSGRGGQVARGARIVARGPDGELEVPLGPRGVTVGSAPECELRLSDARVSRNHAHLMPAQGGVRVRDLGSTNGTFLDGARIDEAVVPFGATLRVGHVELHLGEEQRYAEVPASERSAFGALLGHSRVMREVFGVLERVAVWDVAVVVEGETGTGKELVARAIHDASPRAHGPFVAFDCGAIAASLIESELFGHVRGAFTGAVEARVGAFERAHGGTLFLDEMGELPLELQPKLLRALEAREVRRVGAGEPRSVDVRVVVGTHRDLEGMTADGLFRADLYYRLAVVRVALPPLRARRDDLPLLVRKLLHDAGVEEPGAIEGPNFDRLLAHAWPGNVRELRNVLLRALACSGVPPTNVRFADLAIHLGNPRPSAGDGAPIDVSLPFAAAKERVVDDFERRYLTELLRVCADNVTEVSRRSGLSRRHLYDLLKKYGLRT